MLSWLLPVRGFLYSNKCSIANTVSPKLKLYTKQNQPVQGMFKKYLTMPYFKLPRHTQTMTAYMILTEYVCESWECRSLILILHTEVR